MKLSLLYRPSSPAGISPYRIAGEQSREIPWLNEFLDAQRARGLSLCSVRAYAYDLLHFARWWCPQPPRPSPASTNRSCSIISVISATTNRPPAPRPCTTASAYCAAYTVSITDAKLHGATDTHPHVLHGAPSVMAALAERSAASD